MPLMTVLTSAWIWGCSDVELVSAASMPADTAAPEHGDVPDITGMPDAVWIALIEEGVADVADVAGVAPDARPCMGNGVLASSTESRLSCCFIRISVSYLCEWVIQK
jgi:hypothetical protein